MNTREKQLSALGFCAFALPAVAILPSAGWLWAGLASIAAALLLGILLYICEKRRLPLCQGAAARPLGKLLLLLLLLWNLLALGQTVGQLCEIFPTARETPLIGLLLLLLAAYAAGKKRLLPVAAIGFFFLLGLFALLYGFALPELQREYLGPQTRPAWPLLSAALSPLLLVYLRAASPKTAPKRGIVIWLLGAVVFALLAALIAAGSLGPAALQEPFPFYEAAKSVTVLNAMQRLEPLVSAGLSIAGFCLLGLICAVNGEILAALGLGGENFPILINFLLGGACIFFFGAIPKGLTAFGTTIFWGILPFLLLGIDFQKNFNFFEKKC